MCWIGSIRFKYKFDKVVSENIILSSRPGEVVNNKQKGRRKFSEKNIDPFQNIGMKIQRYWVSGLLKQLRLLRFDKRCND